MRGHKLLCIVLIKILQQFAHLHARMVGCATGQTSVNVHMDGVDLTVTRVCIS